MWPPPSSHYIILSEHQKKLSNYVFMFFLINNLCNGIFIFAATRTTPPLSPKLTVRRSMAKLRILQFSLLSWINLRLPVLHQHWLSVKEGLAQCRLWSLWVHGCCVSTSSGTQANLGHNASDRGVPNFCSCGIGGVLIIHGLHQVYATDCCKVQGSSQSLWHQLTMECMVSLILTP